MRNLCHFGDCRSVMSELRAANATAQMCITSPPYYGLRCYGVDGQIGSEKSPREYIESLVEVFRGVRNILANNGTLWLNLGDCFRKKQLLGIPWRVALALQHDGWHLRSDIIWSKPNPMPASVKDRPTISHEYVFLFAKSPKYYYNAKAIQEPLAEASIGRAKRFAAAKEKYGSPERPTSKHRRNGVNQSSAFAGLASGRSKGYDLESQQRNAWSVWNIATKHYKGAHFAVFPPQLAERCILAGSKAGDTVLDPFMGSGTVAMVAESLKRKWIGCELNESYRTLQQKRLEVRTR